MDKPQHDRSREGGRDGRVYQGWLTVALVTLVIVHPLLESTRLGLLVLIMLSNLIVIACLYAVSWNNRRLAAGLLLAVPSVITTWSFFFEANFRIDVAQSISIILFFVYTLATILQRVFRSESISVDELFGALNVYILLAVSWGLLYSLVEGFFPGSFTLGSLPATPSTFVYFSFSTLGTLGIGDVHPIHPLARSLTIVEMLAGLFFVAVCFGRLVAVFRFDTTRRPWRVYERVPFERTARIIAKAPRWSLVFFIAAANLLTSTLTDLLHMPLFLDTWATSAGAMLGGLWIGLLGGIVYNLLMAALFWGSATWVWAFNSAIVATITWIFWNRNLLNLSRPFALLACGMAIAFASTVSGIVIVNLTDLPRNASTLELHSQILAMTGSVVLADFGQQLMMEGMDKVVSIVVAVIVVFAVTELTSEKKSLPAG